MGAINLPNNIQNDDDLDAGVAMANWQAITQVANGGLEAATNVSTDTAVTQPGSTNSEGTAATLARSDHLHLIQGFENLASDPTTGNFKGRVYWNTATLELRYCTDSSGTGTWASLTPTALELVIHAAQHKDGGHDPLADNTITDHMFAAKTNIWTAMLVSDSANFSGTAWTDIISSIPVTTVTAQTLAISINLRFNNADSSSHNAAFRLVDVTASNTTIYKSDPIQINLNNQQTQITGFFYYSTPIAGGARVFKLQGAATVGGQIKALAPTALNSEAFLAPTFQAVIL